MRKPSALVRFLVPLLLALCFSYASSAITTTDFPGNEANKDGNLVSKELAKESSEVHDEEAKFKGFLGPKPIFKKPFFKTPIPIVKPIPKPVIVKKKFVPVPYKPIPKPIPIVKPTPKSFTVEKPIPIPVFKKPIPFVKPFPKPFLKPKPFFKKPILPEFKKPLLPSFPIHKPIPSP